MTTDERMQKMEGQLAHVKWFNRCLIGCIVLGLGVWFISKTLTGETAPAKSGAKEIRATAFILEDENGKGCAVLTSDNVGPWLLLSDKNQKTRVLMSVSKRGPMLVLGDENGNGRATLIADNDGPCLSLTDENQKTRVLMSVSKRGPMLVLADENGKGRATLIADNDGPCLLLKDQNQKPRAQMSVDNEGPWLLLSDENDKVVWQTP